MVVWMECSHLHSWQRADPYGASGTREKPRRTWASSVSAQLGHKTAPESDTFRPQRPPRTDDRHRL